MMNVGLLSSRIHRICKVTLVSLILISPLSLAGIANADSSNTRADAWGTLEVAGNSWMRGSGVDIYSNGPSSSGPSPDTYHYINNVNSVSTQTGIKWQCVELINRLYIQKGWTTSTWSGNGYQMFGNSPSDLQKESQGSITSIKPGDVIAMSGGYDSLGHVAVVSSVASNNTFTIASQNTSAVYDTSFALVNGSITKSGWSVYDIQGVVHAPRTPYLLVRQGSDLLGKLGLSDAWPNPALTNGASDVRADGKRIVIKNGSGEIWGKDYLDGGWYQITGASDEYAVTPNLIAVRQGGVIKAMEWAVGQWKTPATNAAVHLEASGPYIIWTDTYGNLMGRAGADNGGYVQTTNVDQFDVTPNLLVIRQGGAIYAKDWSVGAWKTPATNAATDVRAAGLRIAWTDSYGSIYARAGADDGGGVYQTAAGTQFEVTPDLLVVLQGGAVKAKAWNGSWTDPATNAAVSIKASGKRIAWYDSYGTLWSRDGAGNGGGFNEISNVTQYEIGGME